MVGSIVVNQCKGFQSDSSNIINKQRKIYDDIRKGWNRDKEKRGN